MKKLYLIILLLLITGCTANIEIEFSRDEVKETLLITGTKEYLKDKDLTSEFANFEKGFENYSKNLIYTSNSAISKEYTYTNDYDNYELMTFLTKCYDNVSVVRRQEIVVSTTEEFKCFDMYPDLEEVKIRIKSMYKAKNNNSDKREGKYYVWVINKDNYMDKPINITFSNEYDKVSASSYTIYIILGIAVVILFIVLKKIRKANSV